MRLSRRNFVKTAAGLVLPAWAAGGASIIVSPPKYSSFGPVYDAEVNDWVARVVANGGTVSTATKDAANTFLGAVNAAGLRSLLWRVNLFASDTYAGVLVPFIVQSGLSFAQSALETAYKTSSFTPATSADWVYSESVGLRSNGSNQAFLSCGFDPRNYNADLTSAHFGIYYITSSNDGSSNGVQDSSAGFRGFILGESGTSRYFECHNTDVAIYTDSGANGFMLGSRTSNTVTTLYRNGVSKATNATGAAAYASSSSVFIFALGGAVVQFTAKTLGGYSIGLKMDATQQLAYYNAWQAFQTALGRQV